MCFCLACSEISSVAACMFHKIYFLFGGTKTIGVVFLSVFQISDDLTFFRSLQKMILIFLEFSQNYGENIKYFCCRNKLIFSSDKTRKT